MSLTTNAQRYIPLCVVIILLVAPHPSIIITLVNHHIRTLHEPFLACVHALVIYFLAFLTFSSLLVCVVRDPGSVSDGHMAGNVAAEQGDTANEDELSRLVADDGFDSEDEVEMMDLNEALTSVGVDASTQKWCKKCMAPKPERAHHCSSCGRCILKMDHHCPWLGSKCIGHRTYPAFIHFVSCVMLQAIYIGTVSARAMWYSFNKPFDVDNFTPVHELCLTLTGLVFALVMGSFLIYHIYLILTNQTTLEDISPFLLLRYLAPPHYGEGNRDMSSNPPKEHELSYKQRLLVKDAHRSLRIYDIGWRRNVAQVFGLGGGRYEWIWRLWCGGSSPGDGRHFPRNARAEEQLARLATELAKLTEMDRHA